MKGTPLNDGLVDYINQLFPAEDQLLHDLRTEAVEAEIPAIHISPEQGGLLGFLLRATGARNVLEVGTLGGYSAITMARAIPEDGHLTTIEVDPHHAEFAREQIRKAGLQEKITVYVGAAVDVLERTLKGTGPYDFAFIDADKEGYVRYVDLIFPLMREGGVIAGDNALAWGKVNNPDTDEENVRWIQEFNRHMARHPGLEATTIVPSGDGMCLGVVRTTTSTT